MIKSLQRDINFSTDPVGAETKIGIVEGNNLQELNVGASDAGAQIESPTFSMQICRNLKIVLRLKPFSLRSNLMKIVALMKLVLNWISDKKKAKSLQIGESQVSTLQDQLPQLSWEESVPTLGDSLK